MPRDTQPHKVYVIAGEASGDNLGACLMNALREQAGADISFCGVGGSRMEQAGLSSLFPMSDLSVMGLVEVLPRVPKILGRIKQTVNHIIREQPDLIITIDSPDFCFRVVKALHDRSDIRSKMVHYVAPTVWAWRPERAKKVAALYDAIMCLYPFEPPYFEREGLKSAFVGHSVMESGYDHANGKALRQELDIPDDAEVLGVLFGSRMGELNRIGPTLRETALRYAGKVPQEIHIVSPTLQHLSRQVRNLLQGMGLKIHVITDPEKKWHCFAAMDKAIATSGTVGLELAVAGVPHLIGYKMNALSYHMVRKKITVKYAHLANILMDKPIVPEFIQHDCCPDKMLQVLVGLDAINQKAAFNDVRNKLAGTDSNVMPSAQAARFLMETVRS